ncbi:Atu2307/SP_0267 family LLM class monooxygenase [Flavihumibacter petaseus]|uniref:Luciferase-like domain-containing protein n=1 Tax=Flavihumibacter petaseus NBRC 106054 TaxID=1220578 RepID=A0A0E9MU86_9BACT|nr:Atu2307/SP_0267 family LLM class monooxygenase [Flavihumibacter petaseus]GAO41038.1 hypothetical protein FPE01S_01_00500 [Flavihumibacter petaseus NBRC 106054]
MELGISSFGEVTPDQKSGGAENAYHRVQEIIEEIRLADQLGLDVYALGEHHRPDYVISSPEMILSAAAAVTDKIRLSSSVTVLSSADPVRIFQQFATLDLVSGGRAEIMAGRGSFIESFPLFGYDLKDYDALFSEKLELLLAINRDTTVNWRGQFRSPIKNQGVYPRPLQESLPVWIAVGGTPESAIRAGKLNLPMTLALLGGTPDRFVPLVNLFRKSHSEAGHDPASIRLAVNSHFYVAEDSQQAADEFYPTYARMMNRVGKERGWPPLDRAQFEYLRQHGPLLVGSPQEVTEKILYFHELFGQDRYLAQFISGKDLPVEKQLKAVALFGEKVAPLVRKHAKVPGL